MIVGEGLIGVLIAGIVAFSGENYPLGLVGDAFAPTALWIGGLAFALTIFLLYRWTERTARRVG